MTIMMIKSKFLAAMLLGTLLALAIPAPAAVYRYKQDGVWHFTDDPAAVPEEQRTAGSPVQDVPDPAKTDLRTRLSQALHPSNPIETAVLATVVVESTFGSGSGFFISADGYVLTNKHVIRPNAGNAQPRDAALSAKRETLQRFEERVDQRQRQLTAMGTDLDEFKRFIDGQPDSDARQYNQARYQEALARYDAFSDELRAARQALASQQAAFESAIAQKRVDDGVAALNRNFTIYLADNTPLYAYVVEISDDLDLALLKVDGYTTPSLSVQSAYRMAQGDPVYAVGNPLKLRNSVTAGIVSGYTGAYIKTNAQIYPGNSGGPLVNAAGAVVGITTFKQITHKYEGLGFAITIDSALDAFDAI